MLLAGSAAAQTRPPVVLLNGYQGTCTSGAKSSAVFGQLEQKLTAQGISVYFFDNCAVRAASSGRPTIEEIGQAFGVFLRGLNVPQVDIVAHSMGGLILRAYLSGMLPGGGFNPPAATLIRKAVLIATPHYGALALAFLFAKQPVDAQLNELLPASVFEWNLNTGNQGTFDFRGVDVLAIAGNGADGTSDGAVPLTSASLVRFSGADHTRVVSACHVQDLPAFLCDGPGIAYINSDTHPSYLIVNSFLAGTTDWQSVGKSAAQDRVLSNDGGADVGVADNNGVISRTTSGVNSSQGPLLGNSSTGVFFGDLMPRGTYNFTVSGAGSATPSSFVFQPTPGVHPQIVVKNGPRIDTVLSATGVLPTLSRAPGMLVAIYGASLAGASVSAAGQPAPVVYASDTQINAVLPDGLSGVVPFTVTAAQGSHTVNLFVEAATPGLFTANSAGDALAVHSDGSLVGSGNPAVPGETITIYGTGLGSAPVNTPAVTIGGMPAQGVNAVKAESGVDLISLIVPAVSVSPGPVVITSAGNSSNTVNLAVNNDVTQSRSPSPWSRRGILVKDPPLY